MEREYEPQPREVKRQALLTARFLIDRELEALSADPPNQMVIDFENYGGEAA